MTPSRPASNPVTHAPGLTKEELANIFTEWAKDCKYDKDLPEDVYSGPSIIADVLSKQFPDVSTRKDIYIMDIAAGSGLVGEKLKALGFTKCDALEPSDGMLELAKAKGVYNKLYLSFITEKPTEIEADTYDVVTVSGGFGENHIPCAGLDELIRIAKPGGLIVNVMSEPFLTSVLEYKDRLEPRMKQLELDHKWTLIGRTVVPRYFDVYNGVVFLHRVL